MPTLGELAPDFELINDKNQPVKLSDFRGQKVVLYFYPKDFTPGCEMQACKFRDHYADITAHNAVVIGISADDADSHAQFRAAHNLPFVLLVDKDFAISQAWNAYGTKTYADKTFTGILRSQYVIDEQGHIIDVQIPVAAGESLQLALNAIK